MKDLTSKRLITSTLLAFSVVLSACSGGGSSSPAPVSPPPTGTTPTPTPTPTPTGPTYTPGVFESASNFKDQCEVVRTGVDIEGNPFPDQAWFYAGGEFLAALLDE